MGMLLLSHGSLAGRFSSHNDNYNEDTQEILDFPTARMNMGWANISSAKLEECLEILLRQNHFYKPQPQPNENNAAIFAIKLFCC